MAFSTRNVRLDGCIRGVPSQRDFRTLFQDRSTPDKVDLRADCTAVENQGEIGSCTSNAAVGALEYLYRGNGEPVDLSRLFVYYNTRRLNGTVAKDTGATIREAMASILAYGACREAIWPYDRELFDKEPPEEAYEDALKHDAIQYARVAGVKGCINALAEGFPVVFGTSIPPRCYDQAATTGIMEVPTENERRSFSFYGHAMLMVGYDKDEQMFIVRNSWGEDWGDGGYCKLPFSIVETCSRPDEFWILSELEKPGNFNLVRPGRASATATQDTVTRSTATVMKLGGMAESATKLRDQIRSGLETDRVASSRKIENLLSGKAEQRAVEKTDRRAFPMAKTATPKNPSGRGIDWSNVDWSRVTMCPTCEGTGICKFCLGIGSCDHCNSTAFCLDCSGLGIIQQ